MPGFGVAEWARARPERTALVWGERRISYRDLDAQASRAARVLRGRGVARGGRVAVALRNRPEFFEAALGAARLGAEVVPVSWRFKADEVDYMVRDSGSAVVVAEHDARATTAGLPALHLGGEWESALAAEEPEPPEGALDPAPVFFRYYTSGTTGRPKAVERPNPDPDAWFRALQGITTMRGLTGADEVHLACGPLYHTAPCAFAGYALALGHTVVLMEHFDAADCLALVERERVTWSHMVPINFVRILALGDARRWDLSSVKRILHAAAPCPVEVKRAIIELFPPGAIVEYYGMTEGLGTIIWPHEWLAKPGSVGRAAPGITLRILGEDGHELPPGEVGVVYVSPMGGVRFAYGGAPDKTAEAWRGDLYTVGDMGYLDADGYLFLTDRKQDMIITGGANVYPAEVEAVLYRHPGVGDVAVIGVPDDEWGERVHAVVEPRAPVTGDELIEFCRERLAHYKCPRSVELVEALPRDPNGKIRKRELREPHWAGRERQI